MDVRVRTVLLLSVWLILLPCPSVGQEAVLSPLGYNASLDSIVMFHCSVTGLTGSQDGLLWLVDGMRADAQEIRDRGIQNPPTVPILDDDDPFSMESTLIIPATFDDTSIQCIAVVLFGANGFSSIAILRIQGLLGKPSNLIIGVLNETHRQLSWDPPFTLDITDQDPDIIAYTVCNNITGSCENTTETQFIFPNLAVHIEFSVTAINIVGEGNTGIKRHEACEPATELEDMGITIVSVTVSFDGASPNAEIRFLQEPACFHIHMVETVANSSGIAILHGPLIPEVIYQDSMAHVTITLDSNLEENDFYSATNTFVVEGGNISLDSKIFFTTFDVQSVEVAVDAGAIVVTLTFAAGSQALGFHLLIIPLSGETTQNISRNVTVEQTGSRPTIFDRRETGLDTGSYLVQIFDWESDGAIDFNNMVHCEQVTVTESIPSTSLVPTVVIATYTGSPSTTPIPPPSTPLISPSSTPPTGVDELSGSDNMLAAIIGCVIGILILLLLTFLVIVVGVWVCCILYHNRVAGTLKADADVPMEQNLAYERVQIELRKVRHVEPNPAYGVVGSNEVP